MRESSNAPLDFGEQSLLPGLLGGVIERDETLQGDEQADDLFFAHLAPPSDPVVGDPPERSAGEIGFRRTPGLRTDIQVELLEGGGPDEITSAAEHARSLGSPDGLPTTEGDKVGALGDEPPQISHGGKLGRGIDQDRHAMASSQGGHLG
jgi:hypothetical protein